MWGWFHAPFVLVPGAVGVGMQGGCFPAPDWDNALVFLFIYCLLAKINVLRWVESMASGCSRSETCPDRLIYSYVDLIYVLNAGRALLRAKPSWRLCLESCPSLALQQGPPLPVCSLSSTLELSVTSGLGGLDVLVYVEAQDILCSTGGAQEPAVTS